MTTTAPQSTEQSQGDPKRRRRVAAIVAVGVLLAGGLGIGLALAFGGSSTPTSGASAYSYQSMMGNYSRGPMMGGSSGSMMGRSGYQWMIGGTDAPGWMTGGSLPDYMTGSNTDPGKVMGQFWANADGDMAHGLVVTANGAASSTIPMMANPPAFSGAALWVLGESNASMPQGPLAFTADRAGTYQYLCPVPGHAQEGMVGTFIIGS